MRSWRLISGLRRHPLRGSRFGAGGRSRRPHGAPDLALCMSPFGTPLGRSAAEIPGSGTELMHHVHAVDVAQAFEQAGDRRDAAPGERTSTSSPPPLAREPGHAGGPSPRRDGRSRLPAPLVLAHLLRNVVQSMRGQLGRCLLAGRLTDLGQFALPLRSGSSRNGAGACGR